MTDVWSLGAKRVVKNSLNPGYITEHTGLDENIWKYAQEDEVREH